jgi:hypothetical protein
MCTIQLPADREKVDPGETVDVGLECIEPLSIKPEKPGFLFKEGGRTVGEGALKLPAPRFSRRAANQDPKPKADRCRPRDRHDGEV